MTRSMNDVEKARFRQYFPNMNVGTVSVSGETTSVYNCISWTVGVTDRWLWPGSSISDFDTFYRNWGFARTSNGPIAAWGFSTTNMTHGNVSGPGHGPRWESKCGQDLRIQHGLGEMEGGVYGRVLAFYSRSRILQETNSVLIANEMKRVPGVDDFTAESEAVASRVSNIADENRSDFEEKFNAWKATWFSGVMAVSSNPYSRTNSIEFAALISLGPKIIPLIVQKLTDPENFLALVLFDALQTEPKLRIDYEATDDRILEGEQGRATRVVQAFLRNS